MFSSLAPARRRLVLGLLAALVVLVVLAAALAARSLLAGHDSRASAPPADQRTPGPVLLVPGYGGSVSSLSTLAAHLRAAGKDVTVVAVPDHAEGDLAAQARVLDAAARSAIARTHAASVDVIGYSAGGVVARLWVKDDGGAAIARRVVTLGSPQHGTDLAVLGSLVAGQCPVACQQLVPTSSLLTSLNLAPELPPGPVFVSLWTSKDQVVVPPESAVLAGAINIRIQDVCADSTVTHTQLPADPLVAGMVQAELGSAAATALTAADCGRLRSSG